MTKNWNRMARIYLWFCPSSFRDAPDRDDVRDAEEMFNHETFGQSVCPMNPYKIGKSWMDITTKAWVEDRRTGLFDASELIGWPMHFLERVFGKGSIDCQKVMLVKLEDGSEERLLWY